MFTGSSVHGGNFRFFDWTFEVPEKLCRQVLPVVSKQQIVRNIEFYQREDAKIVGKKILSE